MHIHRGIRRPVIKRIQIMALQGSSHWITFHVLIFHRWMARTSERSVLRFVLPAKVPDKSA